MPSCSVCSSRDTSFRFLKSEAALSQWMLQLHLTENPHSWSRLCDKHFCECDILVSASGRRRLKADALPYLHPNPDRCPASMSVFSEHSYSSISKSKEAGFVTVWVGVATVLICCLSFLLLLLYCLENDDDAETSPNAMSRRVGPVQDGKTFSGLSTC